METEQYKKIIRTIKLFDFLDATFYVLVVPIILSIIIIIVALLILAFHYIKLIINFVNGA